MRRPHGLAVKLRAARAQAGITQAELSRRVGCSRSTITDYERGRTSPDPERLAHLAAALGVPVSFFYPTPSLLPGEPLHVMTLRQLAQMHTVKKGRPPRGGWYMVRLEHWSERLGGLIWVEVEQGSDLTSAYKPGTVLGVAHAALVPGAPLLALVGRKVILGDRIERDGEPFFLSIDGRLHKLKPRSLCGSIILAIEPAAARAMRIRRR